MLQVPSQFNAAASASKTRVICLACETKNTKHARMIYIFVIQNLAQLCYVSSNHVYVVSPYEFEFEIVRNGQEHRADMRLD